MSKFFEARFYIYTSDKMKVLYIAPDVPVPHAGKFLGGSTHVLKVAESLAAKGCEVFIILI